MRFCLILGILCFLTACNADKLNGIAAKINKGAEESFDKLTDDTPELSSSDPKLSTLEQTNNTLKDINQTYKETKDQVRATKQSISEGVREAKQTAKHYAKKLPQSEKEANQMVVSFFEKYFGNWRASFRRASRQSGMTTASSSKPKKTNESRLR